MASRMLFDDNSNTKSEEGTIAFQKKRDRRVSFAENTSVHIFDRDEDSGTPVDPKPPNSPSIDLPSDERDNEPNQLFWNSEEDDNDNDTNNDDDDMDESGLRSPFLRLVGSPSSGGSTIGSANSNDNDEDNFFGPVSSSFIRRDLLDSGGSDVNHDQTMDSTAFSMHFRSIARSDSEAELKTSTGVHLSFDEKTPTQDSVPTNTGTLMLMTRAKKPNYQPSVSTSKLNNSSDSNDMSIVEEYHHKYDYAELPPRLDALLAESDKDLCLIAPSNDSILKSPRFIETLKSPRITETLKSPRNTETIKENGDNVERERGITHEMVNGVVSLEHNQIGGANDGSKFSPSKQIAVNMSSYASDAEIFKSFPASSSILATPITTTKELVKDAFQLKSSLVTPKNTAYLVDVNGKGHKSPFVGSVNSLTNNPNQMLLNGVTPSKSPLTMTPSHNHSTIFVRTENPKYSGSVASIQKSISKLGVLEASPFSAVLNAKLQDSVSRSLVIPSKMTPLHTLFEKNNNLQSSSDSQKKRERENSTNMDDIRLETPKNGHKQSFVKAVSPWVLPETTRSSEKLQTDNLSPPEIKYGYKDKESKDELNQNIGYSPQKKLKIMDVSEFKSSPLRDVKQSSPIISTAKEMMDNGDVFLHDVRSNLEMKENSTILSEGKDKQSWQKNLHEQFCQSPTSKPPYNELHDDNVDSLPEENVPSPSLHCLPHEKVISDLQTEAQDDIIEKTARIHGSPNLRKDDIALEVSTNSENSTNRRNLKHPTEINALFSKEIGELLSQSIDKFSLQMIDHFAGIMDQLFRSKTYQLLSEEIQSQKNADATQYIRHKRVSETKLLLCKFVYEKSKLQLLNVKRERLLKRVKSLASGISESESIQLKILPHQSPIVHCESSSINIDLQERQINSDKVTSMEHEIDLMDKSITTLTKSFHISCKIEAELNPMDTIAFVNNYLKKRACCQIIRKDMQIWVVDKFESKDGCHNVVLNYLNLMTQRFTINTVPVPSIFISHELDNVNISKIFKDMDVFTAFRFVFDTETKQKHIGATTLSRETQVTGSSFGNLLDVVSEIQIARIELKHLISTRFRAPLAEKLEIDLCFNDSKLRQKATVTLDISCLRRGIYPSEIIPSQIDIADNNNPQNSALLRAKISAASQDLKVGYLRIQQLCKCVSSLVSSPIR